MRLKIIAGNFVVVLLVGFVSFFVVRTQLEEGLSSQVDAQIANDAELFSRSFRLSSTTFLDLVADRADSQPVRDAFGGLDQNSRRTRAFEAANGVGQWFRDPSRRGLEPDLVVITDETGRVIARNQDRNRMHGTALNHELPALRRVLGDGAPRHDVWKKEDENKVLEIAVAQVTNEAGATLGALVVGYDLSNGLAEREGGTLGRDIAFVIEGTVYSSSLQGNGAQNLQAYMFGGDRAADSNAALAATSASSPWQAELGDAQYVGVTAPLPMSPSMSVGYTVLANKTEAIGLASSTNIILILAALGAFLILVYGFIIGTSFLRPLEQIEEGVLAVINGRTDLRLDVESSEFGGLAYRINQLINVFTGVSETDEDGRVSSPPSGGDWQGSTFDTAGGNPGGASSGGGGGADVVDDPAIAAELEAEPETAYQDRIYNEYVHAKTAAGENVSSIRQDVFLKRLDGQAVALVKKHGCRAVRFRVETRGDQVTLTPVLIR